MLAPVCNLRIWEIKAGELIQVQGQPDQTDSNKQKETYYVKISHTNYLQYIILINDNM